MIIVDHNPCRADVTHVYFYRKIDFSKTCFLTSISTKIDVTNIFTLCFYRNFHGSHTPHIDPSSTPFFFIPVCSLLPSFQKSAGSKQMIITLNFLFTYRSRRTCNSGLYTLSAIQQDYNKEVRGHMAKIWNKAL